MKHDTRLRQTFRTALVHTIPVMTGYLVMGMAFGLLLESKGYNAWWALFISLTMYSGSLQFVAVDLLAAGASLITGALMALLVNARHLFYGISMLTRLKGSGKAKPYLIFGMTDETYALLCTEPPAGVIRRRYDLFVALLDQLYWVTGCVAGALLGSALTFNTAGVDFAMTALFVVIVVDQWRDNRDHVPALIGIGVTVACLLAMGPERFLIPAMVCITAALSFRGWWKDRRDARE